MAGMAIGLAALDRIDVLFLVVPVVVVLLLVEWRRAGRRLTSVAVPLALLTMHCIAHALTVSKPYTQRLFRHLGHDRHLGSIVGVALVCVLVAAAIVVARRIQWRPPAAWLANAGLVVVLAVTGWLAIRLGASAATNHLTVLLTAPGLVVAIAGLLVASRSSDRAMWLAIAVVALSAVVFVEAPRDVAGFPRVFRRDVPVLLPLMTLFQARVLFPGWAGWRHRLGAGVLLLALVGVQANRLQAIYRSGTESAGGREAVESIAALLPVDALVIADSREADHLDLAMDATGGRSTVGPRRSGDAAPALRALADRALAANHPVAFLTTDSGPTAPPGHVRGLALRAGGPRVVSNHPRGHDLARARRDAPCRLFHLPVVDSRAAALASAAGSRRPGHGARRLARAGSAHARAGTLDGTCRDHAVAPVRVRRRRHAVDRRDSFRVDPAIHAASTTGDRIN